MNMIKCMRFTVLEEIKSTLPKSLFYDYYSQIKSNQMLVFDERGKPEYPGKNLSWQSRGPTNSIHIWHRVRKSNPRHIGWGQVLSPLGQPCHWFSTYLIFNLLTFKQDRSYCGDCCYSNSSHKTEKVEKLSHLLISVSGRHCTGTGGVILVRRVVHLHIECHENHRLAGWHSFRLSVANCDLGRSFSCTIVAATAYIYISEMTDLACIS